MSYLKAIVISAVVALAIIFMVQNIQALSHPLSIRLNLFFVKFETTPYATYMVILLAFFVGLLVASLLGLAERFRLRKRLRDLRKRNDKLRDELNSLRNMPLNDPVSGPPELEEEEEGEEASQT
jgi:putative membrane protein